MWWGVFIIGARNKYVSSLKSERIFNWSFLTQIRYVSFLLFFEEKNRGFSYPGWVLPNLRSPSSGRRWGWDCWCPGSSLRSRRRLAESRVWMPGRWGGAAGCVALAAELLLPRSARGEEMGLAPCSWPESKASAAQTCPPWSGVSEGEQSADGGEIKRRTE